MAHWRDSARKVTLWMIDFKACFPLLIFFFHIRFVTFFVALFFTIFFIIIQYYGFTLNIFLRWLRSFLAGPHRVSQPWWRR